MQGKLRRRPKNIFLFRRVYYIDFLRMGYADFGISKNYKEDGPMYDLEPAFNQIDSQGCCGIARVPYMAVNLTESTNER